MTVPLTVARTEVLLDFPPLPIAPSLATCSASFAAHESGSTGARLFEVALFQISGREQPRVGELVRALELELGVCFLATRSTTAGRPRPA